MLLFHLHHPAAREAAEQQQYCNYQIAMDQPRLPPAVNDDDAKSDGAVLASVAEASIPIVQQ